MAKQLTYLSYLIRLWRDEGKQEWRMTVINSHSGEHTNFSSLAELLRFLEQQPKAAEKEALTKKKEDTTSS